MEPMQANRMLMIPLVMGVIGVLFVLGIAFFAYYLLSNPVNLQGRLTVLNQSRPDFTGKELVFVGICASMESRGCAYGKPIGNPTYVPVAPDGRFAANSMTAGLYRVNMSGCDYGSDLCSATFPFTFDMEGPGKTTVLNITIGQARGR
jgi:hypothetical protein